MKNKIKYLRHLLVEHWINLLVFGIAAMVATSQVNCKEGVISVFTLCGIFLINFFDHIHDHHKYKNFIKNKNTHDNGTII